MPKAKEIVTSVRVNEELWKEAKIYAIKRGITLAELLNELIRKELEKEAQSSKRE